MLNESEKKELELLYLQMKDIQRVVESKCIFIMRRIRLMLEK